MAETTKLSVGQALEKLRGTEAPKAKMARLDEKIQALDEETQRLRAMRRRLERDQRPVSPPCDTQEVNGKRATKLKNIRDHHRDHHRDPYFGVEVGAFVAVASPPDSPITRDVFLGTSRHAAQRAECLSVVKACLVAALLVQIKAVAVALVSRRTSSAGDRFRAFSHSQCLS